jgi:hypothetical protein
MGETKGDKEVETALPKGVWFVHPPGPKKTNDVLRERLGRKEPAMRIRKVRLNMTSYL